MGLLVITIGPKAGYYGYRQLQFGSIRELRCTEKEQKRERETQSETKRDHIAIAGNTRTVIKDTVPRRD